MVTTSPCTSIEELQQLLLGQTPEGQASSLEAHLAHCDGCVEAILALTAEDSLVVALRQGQKVAAEVPRSELVAALVGRLRGLRPSDHGPAGDTTTDEPRQGAPLPGADATEEVYNFLAPAEGPGELGRLGAYRVLRLLGAGGMGVVFEAEDPHLKRAVALKAMRPLLAATAAARKRFLREAQATAALKHDHIVTIYQVDQERGVPYLAMELLEGETLERRLRREGKLPLAEVLRIGRQVAEGLGAAHGRGLIHRDIKPGNLWLETSAGEPGASATGARVKILDFGLAQAAGGDVEITPTGTIIGTPAYMAPEQARAEEVDVRCDLFSLGCVLYRLCTGVAPFQGKEATEILLSLAQDNPRPPHELDPAVPAALSGLVMQLLAKDRQERPPSARAVADTLAGIEEEATMVIAPRLAHAEGGAGSSEVSPPPRRPSRLGWLVAAAAAAVAAVILLGAVFTFRTKHGTLVVNVSDPDVQVFIDGEEKVTIDSKRAGKVELIPGEHNLEIKQGREVVYSKRFVVKRGEEEVINATWTPTPPDERPPVVVVPPPPIPADSPLAKLDPAKIPTAERMDGLPKEVVAVLGEHRGVLGFALYAIAYSLDGKWIAGGSYNDRVIRIWDAKTLRERAALRGHTGAVYQLAFSPDSMTLASASVDRTVRLWDLTGEPKEAGPPLRSGFSFAAVAFSRDGKVLAAGGHDNFVHVWDLTEDGPRERASLKGHQGIVTAVAFAPDRPVVASSGIDGTVRLWDLAGGKELAVIPGEARVIAFASDGKTLASAGVGAVVVLWDLTASPPTERERIDLPARLGSEINVASLAFTPDGKSLLAGQFLVELREGKSKVKHVARPSFFAVGPAYRFALAPDGKAVAAGGAERIVRVWEQTDPPVERVVPATGHNGWVTRAALAPGGKTLVTGGHDYTVRLWDLTGTEPRERDRIDGLKGPVLSLALTPDGKKLAVATGSTMVALRLWDLTGPQAGPPTVINLPRVLCNAVAFAPDGGTLAAACGDGAVRFWDVSGPKPKELPPLPPHAAALKSLAYRPDGKALAVGDQEGTVLLWNLAQPQKAPVPLNAADKAVVNSLAFAPDGKRLAAASGGGGVRLWDLTPAKPREIATYRKHETWASTGASAVAFTPDGKALLSAGTDGKVASHFSGKEWQLLGPVNALVVAPDGRHVITANANRTAYILRLDP